MTLRLPSFVAGATLICCASIASAQFAQPDGGNLERGALPDHWYSQGAKCMEIPAWQVHEYNPNFLILRQSPCSDYEKPFIFLLFGKDKVLLVDTGSRNGDLAPTLQRVIHNWLERNGRASIPLMVAHTHEHEDHTLGDKGVQALNDPKIPVTFIPAEVDATRSAFRIGNWPSDIGRIDLGGRSIEVIPIPGHSKCSIAFYDDNTGILLAGDTLYPGRLYVRDFAAFQASVERLIRFTQDKPVAHVLGNHIEESRTPFLDYPVGTMYQPDEHQLQLARGALLELDEALMGMRGTPRRLALRDFSVWPSGPSFDSPAENEAYQERVRQQHAQMWDQSRP